MPQQKRLIVGPKLDPLEETPWPHRSELAPFPTVPMASYLDSGALSHIEKHHLDDPLLFEMTEAELREVFKKTVGRDPSSVENQLRLTFWYEFQKCVMRSQDQGPKKMSFKRVCDGVCSPNVFHSLMKKKLFVAWLCCPPRSYESQLEEMVSYGQAKMSEILHMDANLEGPKEKIKLLQLQHHIYENALTRQKGTVAQKQLTLTGTLGADGQLVDRGDATLEKREKELEAAERREKKKSPQLPVIEVEPTDV